MSPNGVRKTLLVEPEHPKIIYLNDGTKILVRNRELWVAGPDYLFVLAPDGFGHHIAYRNIASISQPPPRYRMRRRA